MGMHARGSGPSRPVAQGPMHASGASQDVRDSEILHVADDEQGRAQSHLVEQLLHYNHA